MISKAPRKNDGSTTATSRKSKRAAAFKSSPRKNVTSPRKELTENQIAKVRKQLLTILAVAIRKSMENASGKDIAEITGYTQSQISMLSKGKKYAKTFTTEKILSVMISFYDIKIIVGSLNELDRGNIRRIRISKM